MNYVRHFLKKDEINPAIALLMMVCGKESKDESLNPFLQAYKRFLVGFNKRKTRTTRELKKFLKSAENNSVLDMYFSVFIIHAFLLKNDLREMLPRFNELNQMLAKRIKKLRPEMDARPLESEANLLVFGICIIDILTAKSN